jgi:hypothetical protein
MSAKVALWFLKLGGILIMVVGYYFGTAEFYPSIVNHLVPEYAHAKAGINKLKSGGKLLPKDEGFQTLSNIYFKDLSKQTKSIPKDVKVDSFQYEASASAFGRRIGAALGVNLSSVSKPVNGVVGKFKDDRPLNEFTDPINEMEHRKLFLIGCYVFWFGVAIECLALGVDIASQFRLFLKGRKGDWR